MENQPEAPTPPANTTPAPSTPAGVPQAPKLSLRPTASSPAPAAATPPPTIARPGAPSPATPPRPAVSSPETKPEFKAPAAPTAATPPPPTFGKPPPSIHAAAAPQVGRASDIQMDFLDEEDNKEKLPFVLIDALSLVASVAFAVLLFMQLFSLDGTK